MIVSAVHNADVVLRGRRREVRGCYRLDVPIDFVQVARRDMIPALEVDAHSWRSGTRRIVVLSHGGRLWRPHVPVERREEPTIEDLPGEHAERHAMTEAEFADLAGGAALMVRGTPTHDDPLRRARGVTANGRGPARYTPARDLSVLAEADVKETLWSDRADAERRLRAAAEDILIVDGRIWKRMEEPVLTLHASGTRTETIREVRIRADVPPLRAACWDSLRHFRLDRLDEALDWGNRQGASVVRARSNWRRDRDVVPVRRDFVVVGSVSVLEPGILSRDDARFVLASRARRALHEGDELVSLLPSAAVDAFVALREFLRDPDASSASTLDLYGHLDTLAEGVEALSGLTDLEFKARGRTRDEISPALKRWRSHEMMHHAPAPEPGP